MIRSLYIHIPFCKKKCLYCDFNSYSNNDLQDKYIDALIKEIKDIKQDSFETIFIGGGTPTILSIENMEKLFKAIKRFDFKEYTIEANPGTLTEKKLNLMKESGINRLSIGLQAWQNELLKKLGRIHNIDDFLASYELARKCGFNNINIDLMFGIPNQSIHAWHQTLNNVIKLNPEHISCYGLIVEEGTKFYDLHRRGMLDTPSEDIERHMYYFACGKLENLGYKQYEISNFAKEGYESQHNITYWLDEEYIGVGAGAHSYVDKNRFSNHRLIEGYINAINTGSAVVESNTVSLDDEMSEFMFLGLRMIEGIKKQRFMKRFGVDIHDIYEEAIQKNKDLELLEEDDENIRLTRKGIDLSNSVFVSFLK